MRILYVCKAGVEGQDDEGAIEHALQVLGHRVDRYDERGSFVPVDADLMLFHKLPEGSEWFAMLDVVRQHMPVACWFFDRVRDQDPDMVGRTMQRVDWMTAVMPHLTHLFCTDGDWVHEVNTRPLGTKPPAYWVRQGADERWWDYVVYATARRPCKVLLTCNGSGSQRQQFVRWCKKQWTSGLYYQSRGLYRHSLVLACRHASTTLAPPTPVSGRYCSNRAYTVMAAGGLLLHPHTSSLANHYPAGGPQFYQDLEELPDAVEYWHNNPGKRADVTQHAREQTWQSHLYRHRLEEILGLVFGTCGTRPSGGTA